MSARTPRLTAQGVVKSFGAARILSDVSIEVAEAEVVGLIGENGAGKSTLLDVFSGVHQADSGRLVLDGREVSIPSPSAAAKLGIFRVFQEQSILPKLPVYLNLALGAESHFSVAGVLSTSRACAHAREVLAEVGLAFDERKLAGEYSFGERQLLEIARAVSLSRIYKSSKPIILLDEPTAALSGAELDLFFGLITRLRSAGTSFVFVSHRLPELLEYSDRLYVLKDGAMVAEVGPGTSEAELHRLMVGRERADDMYHKARQQIELGPERLTVANLEAPGFAPISVSVAAGEVLGIGGLLGSGKNELAEAVFGAKPGKGTVSVDGSPLRSGVSARVQAELGFIPLHRHQDGILLGQTVADNINAVRLGRGSMLTRRNHGDENARASHWRDRLRIKSSSLDQLTRRLSGGNQQKIVFAKWLNNGVKVLIADNPTRGVDAGAKEEIYSLMRDLTDDGVAILLVSDDLSEIIGLSNRIIVMKDGAVAGSVSSTALEPASEEDVVALMV